MRRPGVERHIGEHPRAVEKACLGGDNQYRSFGDQRDDHQGRRGRCIAAKKYPVDIGEETCVERFPRLVHHAVEQVTEQDAAGGESE